jgi:hypothetical protein
MKKIFLLAAVAAIVACSKTDNFKETEEAAIDFSEVFLEKSTKASYTDVASLKSDSRGFGVFASKTKQDDSAEKVFGKSSAETNGGAQVTWNTTSSKWTYSPIRYWDKGAKSYHFYAYAPYNAVTTGSNRLLGTVTWSESTANSFKIEGFKQTATVADMVDILTDLTNAANITPTYSNPVTFSFSHILSNINFYMAVSPALKADETLNPVSVNSIKVGAVKLDGSYAYDTNAYKWTITNNSTTSDFNATVTSGKVFDVRVLKATEDTNPASLNTATQVGDPTAVPGLTDLLFIPQTLPTDTKYTVTIQYMIGDETFDKTINLNDFSKTENNTTVNTTQWVSGYKYNYILVIGPTPIEFDVQEIGDWAETDTYYYTID